MRHSGCRVILVYQFSIRQGGLASGVHRTEAHDGLVPYPTHRGRATDRSSGTSQPSQPPSPGQDADDLAAALRGHAAEGCGDRWSLARHRAAIRGRVQQSRPGRIAALGDPQAPGRDGRLRRHHPGVVYGATRRHDRRGVRPDREADRPPSQPDPGAPLPQGPGIAVAPRPGDPRAAQKNLAEHVATQAEFLATELRPKLDAAQAGHGHVFFVDAAHFVFGTFLCCLWSFARIYVRAASGRQRFNVLGAWDAVKRELIAVTNTTVVNTETMCELLRQIAASGLSGPITLVLDNARYQRNAVVQALAKELGITLLYLPSYAPNLNLIERLWKFTKRRALSGRYHPTFAEFRAAIEAVLDGLSTTHAEPLKTLMTLKFQLFEDVSLLAA